MTEALRRRAELTFSENTLRGRHGWLRLTPAYSVRLVDETLAAHPGRRVFEPFSGTGTTPLAAAYRGLDAVATDMNPFLVWLGGVKCARYTPRQRRAFEDAARELASRLRRKKLARAWTPPLKNVERWWHDEELTFVSALHAEVSASAAGAVRDLLLVAFCRTMIALSNVAFNHPSMSFQSPASSRTPTRRARFLEQFAADARFIAESCGENPRGRATVVLRDARGSNGSIDGSFELLVTSPPYPNRMSYVRELRPYMYWLGYLDAPSSAGELDWTAIGGTWGIATSRLLSWTPTGAFVPRSLAPILDAIRGSHPKNGELMARYVHKYFDDMAHHFADARARIERGGSVHYIIGNSTFYGHLVPAEQLYAEQLVDAGFRDPIVQTIRKRNSKKELFEFHVSAQG